MRRTILLISVIAFVATLTCVAQTNSFLPVVSASTLGAQQQQFLLPNTAPLPRMAPELALSVFMKQMQYQSERLESYSDTTFIEAELPDSSQKGEYELVRSYSAQPRSMTYRSVKFTGDRFVKTNVITRVLQSEVDHVSKGNPAASALTEDNYKFSYKGSDQINGYLVHVYHLKPRRKDPSLFKGKIYVDAYSGSLRRVEGSASKSPSFFVRKVEFTQDFQDIEGFTVPVEMHSTAKARIIGKTIISIFHKSYILKARASSDSNALVSGSR